MIKLQLILQKNTCLKCSAKSLIFGKQTALNVWSISGKTRPNGSTSGGRPKLMTITANKLDKWRSDELFIGLSISFRIKSIFSGLDSTGIGFSSHTTDRHWAEGWTQLLINSKTNLISLKNKASLYQTHISLHWPI